MCDSNSKGTCKCVSVSQQFFCFFRHDKLGMNHTLIIHFTFARRIPTNNTIPTYFIFKKKNGSFITSLWKKRRINMLLTNEKKEVERERKIVRRERESERKKHTLLSEKLSDVQ